MSQLQNSQMIAVALGATIGVIGAAGLFIYQKIMETREREQMMDNLESVNKRVSELQVALDTLRAQQEQQRVKKGKNLRKRMASTNSFYSTVETENEVDAISVAETDLDDEFYDCSDDEATAGEIDHGTAEGVILDLAEKLITLDAKIEIDEDLEDVLCDLQSLALWHDNNVEIIWRLARAHFKNALEIDDTKKKDTILLEGIQSCEKFLEEEHADLHKYYALLMGLRSEYLPVKEKLSHGKIFEKHLKIALKLKPDDPTLHHLLGRFQYTVSELSWFEKKICETLFGEVPTSTYPEAIESLAKAEEYLTKPDFENKYFLGQAYLKVKLYNKAVELFKQLLDLPPRNKKQEDMLSEIRNLISTYTNYC